MKTLNINVIALAVSLVFSTGAIAQNLSKTDYKAGKDKIAAEYKSAKAACASLSGNPKDICVAEAKGKESVGKAELEASYKPTVKTRYQARIAKAEADYAVAVERCDDLAGNAKVGKLGVVPVTRQEIETIWGMSRAAAGPAGPSLGSHE